MSMKKIFYILLSFFIVSILCQHVVLAESANEEKNYTLTMVTTRGASHATWAFYPHERFQNKVKEATNGRVTIETR